MAIFPFFGHFDPFFPVGPNPFFGHFFPISGRRPDLGSVQGNWDRDYKTLFGSPYTSSSVITTHLSLSGPVLRDTARLSQRYTPIAHYGVFSVSTWPIGCDTPSALCGRLPCGEHAKWRCDTPLQRGISAILERYPMKTRQKACDTPLYDTILGTEKSFNSKESSERLPKNFLNNSDLLHIK